jgi:hypothetical protein
MFRYCGAELREIRYLRRLTLRPRPARARNLTHLVDLRRERRVITTPIPIRLTRAVHGRHGGLNRHPVTDAQGHNLLRLGERRLTLRRVAGTVDSQGKLLDRAPARPGHRPGCLWIVSVRVRSPARNTRAGQPVVLPAPRGEGWCHPRMRPLHTRRLAWNCPPRQELGSNRRGGQVSPAAGERRPGSRWRPWAFPAPGRPRPRWTSGPVGKGPPQRDTNALVGERDSNPRLPRITSRIPSWPGGVPPGSTFTLASPPGGTPSCGGLAGRWDSNPSARPSDAGLGRRPVRPCPCHGAATRLRQTGPPGRGSLHGRRRARQELYVTARPRQATAWPV